VNIHARPLQAAEMRLVGLVGAALLAGCNLAPGPDIHG